MFKFTRSAVAFTAFACAAFLPSALLPSALLPNASAQTPTTPARFADTSILSVSLPPNARLRLDVDARDEDLLGVVKSFLRGFNGQTLDDIMPYTKSNTAPSQKAPSKDMSTLAALKFLSDTELETILRDVKHLRVVAFETPYTFRDWNSKPKKPNLATISYYENAYITREGGRRIVRADFDDMQFLTVGFPGGGFGVVMQMPGAGVVVRADGFPNLEGASPMLMALMVKLAGQMR